MCLRGRNASKMHIVRQAGQSTADAHRDLFFLSHSSLISGEIFLYLPERTKICHFFPQGQQPKHPKPVAGHVGDTRSTEGTWGSSPTCFPKAGWEMPTLWRRLEERDQGPFPCCCCPFVFLGQSRGEARTLPPTRCVRAPTPLKKTSLRSS